MNCDALSRYLDLYLDGELAPEERVEIEVHLRSCPDCREAATSEARFRGRVRETLLQVRAPRSLHDQVARRLSSRRFETTFYPVFAYAAGVLLLAGIGYGAMNLYVREVPDPLEGAVAVHAASSGTEVFGDATRIASFLKEKAPFQARIPFADREGLRLVGARVTTLGTRPAVVFQYDAGGRQVSVAQYPRGTEAGAGGAAPRLESRDGYLVASYPEQDLVQTVIGDMPEQEVQRFLPASFSGF